MSTFLFDKIVFGPITSRRLGISLGINLLPADGKVCSFNCVYCECGLNEERLTNSSLPTRAEVKAALHQKLTEMQAQGIAPDVITFAGNGEPTMHPEFAGVIDDTLELRNELCPQTRIAVLSNATMLHKEAVCAALNKIDDNILKLDSVSNARIQQLNVPRSSHFTAEKLIDQLAQFGEKCIIQTMFLRGEVNGESADNTTEAEVSGWITALKTIRPRQVMIYTIDRETPLKALLKVSKEELESIATRARAEGFEVSVSG